MSAGESSTRFGPRVNTVKEKLGNGETVLACWISTLSPVVVETLGYAGFDAAIYDAEHFPYDSFMLENLIRTAEVVGMTPIVKMAKGENRQLTHALDSGAMGVHFAEIETAQDAEERIRAIKYHPNGHRGLSFSHRAARHGFIESELYLHRAKEETMAIIVIENVHAYENLDEILEVPGIDVISIGPHDLSHSMGIPDQIKHPKMQEAFATILRKATAKRIPVGTGAWTPEMARERIEWGMRYIHWSHDLGIFGDAATAIAKDVRQLAQAKQTKSKR